MATPVALTLACFLAAAARQDIPAPVMWGLYATEGGWVGASQTNTDGSHDLGPMQVNDRAWVPKIADLLFGGNRKQAAEALQWDGCFNAQVAAWIYRQYLVEDGGDLAKAVGHYNSHSPDAMARYQAIYKKRFMEMYGPQLTAQGSATTPAPLQPIGTPPQRRKIESPDEINAFLSGSVRPPGH
jgi:hypothetical protein